MKPRVRVTVGLSLAFFTVWVAGGLAQTAAQFEGQRIDDVEYRPANGLDPSDLNQVQLLTKGTALHSRDVAATIDALFSTGRFEDIAAEAERSATGGVVIRFVTKLRMFVGGISVEGKVAAPPNNGQLRSSAQLTLGAPFEQASVDGAVQRMKRLFQSNGFYEATVDPMIDRPAGSVESQQVFIRIQVHGGNRAKYDTPVLQGAAPLDDSTVVKATGWRYPLVHWWKQVSAARTRSGVQGVLSRYEKDDRLLARVDLQDLQYNAAKRRVIPHLAITPGPRVKLTTVEDKVSTRVLKRYVPVFEEQEVDNDLLVEGRRNLHDYLQSQGYYDADVDFRIQPTVNDLETIEYVISKGQRFRMVHLEIHGNKYFDAATIRERMFIAPSAFNLRRGRYSDAFRRRDEATISDLYKSNGFRDVRVTITEDRNYHGKAGDVSATVSITEGTQWLVDRFSANGVEQANRDDVLGSVTSLRGQPFSEVSLAVDRNAILTWYYTHGFPNATFRAEWRNADAPNRVEVTYTITEGAREYVRAVLTHGLSTTRAGLVNKAIALKPGDPLSPVEQTEGQKRLYDLGVFARVDTAIENPDGSTQHKFLLYDFQEANRYTLNIGVGAQVARFGKPSTQSLGSPAGSTGFSPEFSLNVSRINFLGLGHTVSAQAVYSSIQKSGSLSYQQPRFLNFAGRNITYSLTYQDQRDVRTFASKREEGSVQISQKFSKATTGLFRFAYRRVSASQVVIPVLLIPQLLQPVRLGILSTNLLRDRRDNPANPHRGSLNSVDLRLATRYFGSQRSFGAALVRNASYYRLTPNLVLARQTEFGVIRPFSAPAGLSEQESVPLPERFFAGGADSLRAFAFNEAGPRDTGAPLIPGGPASQPTGFPLGGNALFVNNVELRFPLLGDNIQGVFFHDMGNVFTSLTTMSLRFHQRDLQDFNYTAQAAGFGIRYRTPVGPVRVDLAYSLNPPSFEGFSGTPQQLLTCDPNNPASLAKPVCQVTKQSTGSFQFFFSIGQTF